MIRTRTIRHRNGRREILRVLSAEDLVEWKSGGGPLNYERSIVWLENIDQLPFVRVVMVNCAKSRRGPLVLKGSERVVGYAKLMADAPRDPQTSRYTRRMFYLKETDTADSQFPERSVDPKSILPGVAGEPPHSNSIAPSLRRS